MERRLAAVLVADVVGYSRLMEADEAGTLHALKARRKGVIEPVIKARGGRIVKVMGDGVLVEFASAVNACRKISTARTADIPSLLASGLPLYGDSERPRSFQRRSYFRFVHRHQSR